MNDSAVLRYQLQLRVPSKSSNCESWEKFSLYFFLSIGLHFWRKFASPLWIILVVTTLVVTIIGSITGIQLFVFPMGFHHYPTVSAGPRIGRTELLTAIDVP